MGRLWSIRMRSSSERLERRSSGSLTRVFLDKGSEKISLALERRRFGGMKDKM